MGHAIERLSGLRMCPVGGTLADPADDDWDTWHAGDRCDRCVRAVNEATGAL